MTISHHSHSGQFCAHAKGTLEEVVLAAIAKGFTTFGLSEHVPRYRTQDLYPEEEGLGVDYLATQFELYLAEAWRLKAHYAPQITLLVGLETEYINSTGLSKLQELIAHHGDRIQYLVGSVHHCHEQPIDFDQPRFDAAVTDLEGATDADKFGSLFEAYFDAQHGLLSALRPAVVGHFDLCRLYYPDKQFREWPRVWTKIQRNIKLAVEYGALFEINSSAFRKGWTTAYPGRDVFEEIVRQGGRFTLSDDSHGPLAVGLHYDKAYRYAGEQGLTQLWCLQEVSDAAEGTSKLEAVLVEGKPWLDRWPALPKET